MSKKNIVNSPQLLNVAQAATFLGVNAGTIRRWSYNKQLDGIKVGLRGDWRFKTEDLLKLVKSGENVQTPQPNFVQPSDWHVIGDTTHFVQFYENDDFLLDAVREFIQSGDCAIVVATKEHRNRLEKGLILYGIDLPLAIKRELYVSLDAKELLEKFMVDGLPHPERFRETVGGLVSQISKGRQKLRVFGEMVALLWAEGNQAAAIRLEELWNDLQKTQSFSLFCAYPMQNVKGEIYIAPFAAVCETHTGVIPAESYAALENRDERLREIAHLQQRAKSLEAEIEKRKKLEQQKDEFIALASHELKTPVTSLKIFTQVLQNNFQKKGDMNSVESLGKMNAQVDKLTHLIEDLLDASKIEAGKLQFHKDFFSLEGLISEIVEEIQRTTKKHTIAIVGKTKKSLYGDRDRIGQVLTNLLTNAIKYSPHAKRIMVQVSATNKEIQVSVQDFGMGISQNEQEHIFERFYRESGLKQHTFPGLGLGLYISSEIIKRHDGQIWVESEKEKGSTFSFRLPLKVQ